MKVPRLHTELGSITLAPPLCFALASPLIFLPPIGVLRIGFCASITDDQVVQETTVQDQHAALSATLSSDFHMGEVS